MNDSPSSVSEPVAVPPTEHWRDRITQAYYGELGGERFAKITRNRINWIASNVRGDSVLDVGCSQGILAILLAREGFEVTGIDISEAALNYASLELAKETPSIIGRVKFLRTELADFNATEKFDTVVLGEIIEHQTQPARFIRNAARHVKTDGRIVLTAPFGFHPYPDHKNTVFPSTLEAMVGGLLEVEELGVFEGYIRFVGIPRKEAKHKYLAAKAAEQAAVDFKKEVDLLNGKVKTIEKKASSLQEQNNGLTEKTKELSEQMRSAVSKKETELQKARDASAAEISRLREQTQEWVEKNRQLNEEKQQAESRIEVQGKTCSELTEKLKRAELDHLQLIGEMAAREAELQKARDASAAEISRLREQAQEWVEKNRQLNEEKQQAESRIEVQGKTCSELAEKLKRAGLDHLQLIGEIQASKENARNLALNLERQTDLMQSQVASLENRVQVVREMISFQLGAAILEALKSPVKALALPAKLRRIHIDAESRRRGRVLREEIVARGPQFRRMIEQLRDSGLSAVLEKLSSLNLTPTAQASTLTAIARELYPVAPQAALSAAREAQAIDPKPYRAKWLAFRLFDLGKIDEPASLLAASDPGGDLTASEKKRADEIGGLSRLKSMPPQIPPARAAAYVAVEGSILYVAASALPYHTTGYTTRTHELLFAMKKTGTLLTTLTRPGYPWDRADRQGLPQAGSTILEGIEYQHLRTPSMNLPLDLYLREAARAIARFAKSRRVAAIHAASNYANGLPALLAARELGIPFIYEMRGLWDLTRTAKWPGYDQTERFSLGMDLEVLTAKHAERVYVISKSLGTLVQSWGIGPAKIHLLPNCVNAETIERSHGAPEAKPTVFTVGYAGALVAYEGIDILIEALAGLKAKRITVHARIIGDGSSRAEWEALAKKRKLANQIEFVGKVPPDQARRLLAGTHAVVIPRLPHRVCELIPPIKLAEAMASGMAAIVPDLPAFREEVRDGETALLFRSGSADALADKINQLRNDPALAARIGAAAREHAKGHRLWGRFADDLKTSLEEFSLRRIVTSSMGPIEPFVSSTEATRLAGDSLLDSCRGCVELLEKGGIPLISGLAWQRAEGDRKTGARTLLKAAKFLAEAGRAEEEYDLAVLAVKAFPGEEILRAFFWVAQRSKHLEEASNAILALEKIAGEVPTPARVEHLLKLKNSPSYLLTVLKLVKGPGERPAFEPRRKRICYVLHNSLPYSSGGYATRSHGVAGGLKTAGYEVIVLTRPGFPIDIKREMKAEDVEAEQEIDGICYVRALEPLRAGLSTLDYITAASDVIEAKLREFQPELVIGSSNHVTGLPALIAARRVGVPFIYEVRGLWEITRMSREHAFAEKATFAVQRIIETSLTKRADHVFTLTAPMKKELIERGAEPAKIDLLPNACDPDRFLPVRRDEALAAKLQLPSGVPVIGYIGTFVDYEGLEDLAAACGLLKMQGVEFRLLMVGNENASGQDRGPITEQILKVAAGAGYSNWLVMPGRIPHGEVESHYSLIDIAPFPRKPWPVCEMVSPMKPLEALAMEKAVVVSSVQALVEMISDEKSGLIFEKGNIERLAGTLKRLVNDPELRARLGRNGREWVVRERTWKQIGQKLSEKIGQIVSKASLG